MAKPISVGDLVMVVCGCPTCYDVSAVGRVFRVVAIYLSELPSSCCGWCDPVLVAEDASGPDDIEICCLKRLDPDAINDDVPAKEELTV